MRMGKLAVECREYAEENQSREFDLKKACRGNAIATAEYIRQNTEYTPLVVWGYIRRPDTDETSGIDEAQGLTHFWVRIEENGKIIDISPVDRPDFDTGLDSNEPYYGYLPSEYESINQFHYEGWMTPADLASKSNSDMRSSPIQES